MKITSGALALLVALGCSAAVPVVAQDNDHRDQQAQQEQRRDQVGDQNHDRDRDHNMQDRDRDNMQNRDEHSYVSNKYYQQGWKDGQKHKRKNHKWKNDDDRRAYEAGFGHGDRGETWQNSGHKRDKDDDHGRDHSHP